jgi:uncharacterized protein (DUF488 family)
MAELLELLGYARIGMLIDVRAYPASRRHPQFGREPLAAALAAAGIAYFWEGRALGGMRRASPVSPHVALDARIRGFADHMESDDFRTALDHLMQQAKDWRPAVLCAEREPARCHRALISDVLVAAGHTVTHLIEPHRADDHRLDPRARRDSGRLVYDVMPGGQHALDFTG